MVQPARSANLWQFHALNFAPVTTSAVHAAHRSLGWLVPSPEKEDVFATEVTAGHSLGHRGVRDKHTFVVGLVEVVHDDGEMWLQAFRRAQGALQGVGGFVELVVFVR